ncbi:hypothetical protein TUM12151_02560 [Morganella morganii]|nr:hypothetical protein TUM12149_27390 [Morganella morganii]GIZ31762.1 hypothetical protein TUM12150_22480 [Morganella morganii]GIZ33270.1 hypothetical protein TUM12151_02560 [Morganella morganii]
MKGAAKAVAINHFLSMELVIVVFSSKFKPANVILIVSIIAKCINAPIKDNVFQR